MTGSLTMAATTERVRIFTAHNVTDRAVILKGPQVENAVGEDRAAFSPQLWSGLGKAGG